MRYWYELQILQLSPHQYVTVIHQILLPYLGFQEY